MDALEFIAALVQSLAWPAAIVTIGMLFRRQLISLLPRLESFKVAGSEATFGQALAAAEVSVENFRDSAPEIDTQLAPNGYAADLAATMFDASAIVLRAWSDVERALFELARQTIDMPDVSANVGKLLLALRSYDVVNDEFTLAMRRLQALRNDVAHGRVVPTRGEALAFADEAGELAAAARAISKVRGIDP